MAHFPKKTGASFTKGGASVAHFGIQLGAFSKFSSGDTAEGRVTGSLSLGRTRGPAYVHGSSTHT